MHYVKDVLISMQFFKKFSKNFIFILTYSCELIALKFN